MGHLISKQQKIDGLNYEPGPNNHLSPVEHEIIQRTYF